MRILHTSDWHVGRTFHGTSTLETLSTVLSGMAAVVAEREVDVVVVAGDVFDSAVPSGDAYRTLSKALTEIRDAGAVVVLTAGNHDSSARLGFLAPFTSGSGVHIVTRAEELASPIVLEDEHGPVSFFGITYLEPALVRHLWDGVEVRSQADAMRVAMDQVRAAAPDDGRSVVVAHTFVSSGARSAREDAGDAPRDFTQGGVDVVPVDVFDGVTYAALGHLHGRQEVAPHVRYSGAPLFYSFGEAGRRRGAWLVDLDAELAGADWVDLPIPRQLAVLEGKLEELLTEPRFEDSRDKWVQATLTDDQRPMDAMRRLQTRFPHCVHLEFRPERVADRGPASYAERVRARSDVEIFESFLERVRNGEGPSEPERALFGEVMAEQQAGAAR